MIVFVLAAVIASSALLGAWTAALIVGRLSAVERDRDILFAFVRGYSAGLHGELVAEAMPDDTWTASRVAELLSEDNGAGRRR